VSAATLTRCECGNVATPGGVACEWCEAHEDCRTPAGVRVGRSHMAGTAIAWCEGCGMRWGYWDCACDLAHECPPCDCVCHDGAGSHDEAACWCR